MSDSKNPLRDSAFLLAGATAFLYCVSTAYANGYLSTLRLDSDVLDRNFHQVLYNGFLVCLQPILVGLSAYACLRLLYSHLILPEIINWLCKAIRNKRRYIKIKRKWSGGRKERAAERVAKQKTISLLRCLGLAISFLLSLVYFEMQGKKAALDILKQINGKQISESGLIKVVIDNKTRTLVYLGCGARNCAGMELISKTVYYFPQNGHSYRFIN